MAQLHACPASHASFAASAAWALAKRTEASPRSPRDKPNPAPWPHASKNTPSPDTLSIPRRSTGGTYHDAQGTGTFETPKQALAKQLRLVPNRKPRPRSSGRHLQHEQLFRHAIWEKEINPEEVSHHSQKGKHWYNLSSSRKTKSSWRIILGVHHPYSQGMFRTSLGCRSSTRTLISEVGCGQPMPCPMST